MKKYDRLPEDLLIKIQSLISQCKTASELAKEINFGVSGVIKHIKAKRILKPSVGVNKCGNKIYCCHKQDVCCKCFYKKSDLRKRECRSCKRNCNQVCKDFTEIPQCPRLKKYPYVCNCCPDFSKCRQNKYLYEAAEIWKAIKGTRSSSRAGVRRGDDKGNIIFNNWGCGQKLGQS